MTDVAHLERELAEARASLKEREAEAAVLRKALYSAVYEDVTCSCLHTYVDHDPKSLACAACDCRRLKSDRPWGAKAIAALATNAGKGHLAQDEAREKLLQLAEAALAPFAHFINMFDRKPIRGIANEVYGTHMNDECEASLRLSDCRTARSVHQLLAKKEPR